MNEGAGLLTIQQLAVAVAAAVEAGGITATSGRVRAIPDVRTLRYYTSLGLLDRPVDMRGRTALYSQRHLLQLVAIKRLQAQGLPLAEVQARLVNASDRKLAQLAGLPDDFQQRLSKYLQSTQEDAGKEIYKREPRRVFWKLPPERAADDTKPGTSESSPAPPAQSFIGIPLSDNASLFIGAVRPLNEADLTALRAAAQPLVETLRHRGLLT